jgi:tyrosine-protein kinase Etk/Wzc
MNNSTKDPFFYQSEPVDDFNLSEVFYKYLSYWKWFIISFLLALGLAFLYLNTQTPEYAVYSSILIKDDSKGLGQEDMLKQFDIFSGSKVVDNEIEVLKSYDLMERVVTGLNLQVSYFTNQNFSNAELYAENCPINIKLISANEVTYEEPLEFRLYDKNTIAINGEKVKLNDTVSCAGGTFYVSLTGKASQVRELKVQFNPVDPCIEDFMSLLKVEPSSKMSSVLLMSLKTSVPKKGKDILNRLIEEYNKAGLQDKNKVAYNTLAFIDKRLKLVASDLKEVEKEVEVYKSREGITDIGTESKLFLESVQQNDLQLNQVLIQFSVLNSIDQYVRSNTSRGIVPATLGVSDPTLLALIGQFTELQTKRAETVKVMKADNVIMLALDKQIENTRKGIIENIQTFKRSLIITREKLETQNKVLGGIIKTIPGKERKLVDITRQQAIKNDIYVFLLQKREETALSYAAAVSDSRTIDRARSGNEPVKPVKRNVYLIFCIIGIAMPVGFIYISDILNNKIKNRTDIEQQTGIPIFGEISYSEHEHPLLINKMSRSFFAEQIRSLRTNLSFLMPGKGIQSLLFTSSLSGEGKSFISLNLGASFAMIGKKTVILEMDLRKPKLHSSLNIKNDAGVSEYLMGAAEFDAILQPVPGQEGYYIITCGRIPPNPAELFINGRIQQLFEELRARFDLIIIDAPPVGIVTDAQILEQYTDATLFIVRHDFTPKHVLKMVDSLSREKKFKNLNLVFNAIKEGGKYGYGYGYSYEYHQ